MDGLRYQRILEISKYDLDYANESLAIINTRLADLQNLKYESNIPSELFLDIHLTVDDKYLLEKRITYLLDKQLDEYYAQGEPVWNKKNACELLKNALDKNTLVIPLISLIESLAYSLATIPSNFKKRILRDFGESMQDNDYITKEKWSEILSSIDFQ